MHLTLAELLRLERHHQLSGYFHSPQMTSRCVVFEVSIKLPLTRYIWESDIIGNMELERLKAGL